MGISGISITSLILILLIIILLFGTNKIRSIGSDLGSALRSFRKGLSEDVEDEDDREEKDSKKLDKFDK